MIEYVRKNMLFTSIIFVIIGMMICTIIVSTNEALAEELNIYGNKGVCIVEVYSGSTKLNLESLPFIDNGEIYLPLREVLSKFTLDDINWDDGKIQITMPGTENPYNKVGPPSSTGYELYIGSTEIILYPDNHEMYLRNAPILKDSLTYVPIDFFEIIVSKGQMAEFELLLIQSKNPTDYYIDEEEVFIGTGYQQDNYNPVDENGNVKYVKRIIVNESNEIMGIVTVENQKPEVLAEKLLTKAPKLHVYSFSDIFNSGYSYSNMYDENIEAMSGIFVHDDKGCIAYIPPADLINRTPVSSEFSNTEIYLTE